METGMFKEMTITDNTELENTQPSFVRKVISSVVLSAYIFSFVLSPVYASTEVMEPLPSRFGRYDRFDEPVEPALAPKETPLQQQFRLWQKLPALARAPLPFDEAYQPLGWSDRYQLSLGFDDVHAARVFSIPAGKDFVNAAGAQWLQTTYGDLGWNCQLNASGSALSFSYSPTGITDTIAFLLYRSGNVRLTALNTKSAILHTAQVLSLAFVDDTVIPPNLIVGAPVVSNETELTTEQLGIFTQEHENRGGYIVDHGEIRAKTTLNKAFIKVTKQWNVNGHSWVNRAAITGEGHSAFILQENLDNTGQVIQLGETLSIQAASVNNHQGTLTGLTVRTQVTGSIDNTQGKISSTKRVRISAQTLMNETGLISSPDGLDLRNIDDVQVGGIDTHGDVLLKEGHFTFTSATAMGNADGKTEHKIRKLVIEPNSALPEHLPVELQCTINAKAYRAHFSTTLGSDVRIDQVNTDDNAKVTFTPGQIKRLITRMKDNPLTPALIQDLERLDWLLEDETDVLPYDVNMAGQLILRLIPGGVAIPKWLITKNAHASKGLELHLRDSDIIMGDGAGTTYPEWIADTGPLHMFGKTMDQRSGLIAACAGGSIETLGKLKLGETQNHKYIFPGFQNFKGEFYSLSDRATAVYSGAPLLLASATEDVDTLFLHVDSKDLTFRTPKDVNIFSTLLEGEGIWNIEAQHLLVSPDSKYVKVAQYAEGCASLPGMPRGIYGPVVYNTDYIQRVRHYDVCASDWLHLAKDFSKLNLEGKLRLNLSKGCQFFGGKSHIKGEIEYVNPLPLEFYKQEKVCECGIEVGYVSDPPFQKSYTYQTAELSVGASIDIPARTFSMEGALLRSPVIRIRTADGRVVITGERSLQRRAEPQTLYDLQKVIRTGALTKENSDETGPRIIPRFTREPARLIPPPVFLIPGLGLTLTPPPGTRLQFDASLEAKALPDALASMGFGQGYLYPRMGSRDEHLLMRTFAYALYKKVERDSPHLIAGGGARALLALTNAQQKAEASGDLISYIGTEGLGNFKDKPMIGYSPQGKPVIFVPKSFAHRSLQASMTAILADERATVEGLDGEAGSRFFLNGAMDGGKLTELLNDHTIVARPTHTTTHSYSDKKGKHHVTITQTHIGYGGLVRGDDVAIEGVEQHFSGTLDATHKYLLRGSEHVEVGVTQTMRQVNETSTKSGAFGSKSSKFSSSYSITPTAAVLKVRDVDGVGVIASDQHVDMTAPHFAAEKTVVQAPSIALREAHRISGGSSFSSSSNAFVNVTRVATHHSDQAIAAKMDGEVVFETSGDVQIYRPVGVRYDNLQVDPRAHLEDREVQNIFTSHSKTHRSLGIAPIAALGILGSLVGGQAFVGLFGTGAATGAATVGVVGTAGTAGVATATVGVAGATATTAALTTAEMFSITALGMAKAATMFVGASVFQGVATGHINISARGLAAAVATAGLIGSGPIAGADVTFTDMLGQQMVHAVQTAPIHTAINMAIGQEKFGDAITSSLRHGVGHAIGASLAHQMGQWYSGPDKINYFMHKMGHFASGAVGGAITADDPLGGAFGAAFAEVSMEAMADAEKVSQDLYKEKPTMNDAEFNEAFHDKMMAKRFFSQVIGGFVGTLAGNGNFSVAASTAAIALDYNMCETMAQKAKESYQEAQQYVETNVEDTLQTLERSQKHPYTAEKREQVRDNLRKLYMRSYFDGKACGLLVEGAKFHPATGAVITAAEGAYDLATGERDFQDVAISMVGATSSLAGRAGQAFNLGSKVSKAGSGQTQSKVKVKALEAEDVVLEFKEPMNRRDYARKVNTLSNSSKSGDLFSSTPHGISDADRRALTRTYRKQAVKRIERIFVDNPQAKSNALERLKRSDIDHMVDLQLGGSNTMGNLRAMDSFTNQDLGRQIARQLPKGKKVSINIKDRK